MSRDLFYMIKNIRLSASLSSLRQVDGEISGRSGSSLGILLTANGTPLTDASASVDLELMREADGVREKKRVIMAKCATDGFYSAKLKTYFSTLVTNRLYSYCISSGGTIVDSTVGTLRVSDSVTGTEILERVNTLQRYFDHKDRFLKKEIINAAPQPKNA